MKRTLGILSTLSLALLCGSAAQAKDRPNFDASFQRKAAPILLPSAPALTTGPRAPAMAPAARASRLQKALVASLDRRSGAPSFVWGARAVPGPGPAHSTALSPAEAAAAHLAEHADLYGLSPEALATARVAAVHDTGRGGIIVTLRQEIGGVPLFHNDAKVLLRRDLSLVALSGSLHPRAVQAPKAAGHFALPYAGAVARALSDLYTASLPSSVVAPSTAGAKGEYHRFDIATPGAGALAALRFERPARARKVYFAKGSDLVPAYYVEVFAKEQGGDSDAYAYVISAEHGDVLLRRNLTADAAFKYRVWADSDKRPLDGPVADFTPHPTGVPDDSAPAFIPPSLVTADGFNKTADPWLANDATESAGNNVNAYIDHDDEDSPAKGVHATTTAMGEFDRVYDTSKEPLDSPEQGMAAVTQLFYTNNWLHDYWYDSGFDEAAGNAQQDNYGRGGNGGDPILAEGQDAYNLEKTNNANMNTPADGESPRMQMYIWDGKETRALLVDPSNVSLKTGSADFGPKSFDIGGDVILADDGTATKTDACEEITNAVAGKIVLVDRGDCTFQQKAANAQNASAIGVILANHMDGGAPNMPGDGGVNITIPILSITKADGAILKTALAAGPVSVTLQRTPGVQVDGTIDNLIVAHEWGHYLHHRLVDCGLNQCGGESEGWGDFVALTTQLRPEDDLDGTFSDSTYAATGYDNYGYFGVRRYPYSTDMTKNPLTFTHIQQSADLPDTAPFADVFPDNSEVHNTGEVWATMLFEGLAGMLKLSQGPNPKYTFEEARRKMVDYAVAGLKLAPVEPTFTEQRDAIIAAALADDEDDGILIAQGFARRGAGSCAVSPPADSGDNNGVKESYVVGPAVAITEVAIDDSAATCDHDGVLDANEKGNIKISIANRSFMSAADTKVSITSKTPGLTFPDGAEMTLPVIDGLSETEVTFTIAIDPKQSAPAVLDLTITAENAAACEPTVVTKRVPRVNYDNEKAASTSDDFESAFDVWKRTGTDGEAVWNRETDDTGNRLWHGLDFGTTSDTALVSPALTVSGEEAFVLSFKHRHTFETSLEDPDDPQSPVVFWDGAVIEITSNNGASWEDVSKYADPGYSGQIGNLADNPLADREGYTDQNPSWPSKDTVTLDFGEAFAGKEVKLRFRIGTDEVAGELGWELDDVSFKGIVGTPFPRINPDAQSCAPAVDHAPIAKAGADQTVEAGDEVRLDASSSSDPDKDPLTFSWSQAEGTGIVLSGDNTAKATFKAPDVTKDTTFNFAVKVTANNLSSTDTVKVLVKSKGEADELLPGGGCGCAVPGESESPAAPLGALGAAALGLLAYRRRRPS